MTIHQNFPPTNPGNEEDRHEQSIRTPVIDEIRIRHIALTGNLDAAREYAATTADRLNAGLRARFEALRGEAQGIADNLASRIAGYDAQADSRSEVRWRRLNPVDALARMTRWEIAQCAFYIALTLIALGVATYALALMIMEKEVIEKLTISVWQAIVYSFPVVLASSGVAAMATLHDDEKVIEARTLRTLKWGVVIFLAWSAMTALVFVGQEGGYNPRDILSTENDPFAAVSPLAGVEAIDHAYAILRALFPSGVTSSLLLFVHIVAEVLIAAGLTARVVLMGRKTREIEAYHCKRSSLARQKADELQADKQTQTERIAHFTNQIAEIDAVKAQFIEDVMLLAESEGRLAQAMRQVAQTKADLDYLNTTRVAAE